MEILGESPDGSDISMCGSFGVITALEFLEHLFSKLGHRDLLVTHTLTGHQNLCDRPPRVASAARAAQFTRRYRTRSVQIATLGTMRRGQCHETPHIGRLH